MNLGFVELYLCNFITKVLDMLNILDAVSCIITQHVWGRLYFYIYSNNIILFDFMCGDNVD